MAVVIAPTADSNKVVNESFEAPLPKNIGGLTIKIDPNTAKMIEIMLDTLNLSLYTIEETSEVNAGAI